MTILFLVLGLKLKKTLSDQLFLRTNIFYRTFAIKYNLIKMTKKDQTIKYITSWVSNNSSDFIPSEFQLIIKLGFSRNTIRNALHDLVAKDVLIPIKGKGYIYNEHSMSTLRSFKSQYGIGFKTVFLKEIFSDEYNKHLQVQGFVELIKVRYNADRPFILAKQYVPAIIFRKLDPFIYKKSLFDAFKNCGIDIAYAIKKISYIKTPHIIKSILPFSSNNILLLECTTYSKNKIIIEYSKNYYYPETFNWKWTEKFFK